MLNNIEDQRIRELDEAIDAAEKLGPAGYLKKLENLQSATIQFILTILSLPKDKQALIKTTAWSEYVHAKFVNSAVTPEAEGPDSKAIVIALSLPEKTQEIIRLALFANINGHFPSGNVQ